MCEQELCPYWSGEGCVCSVMGIDAEAGPVFIQGHNHSEPVCAWPDCKTYLTPEQMARLRDAE